RRKHAYVRLTYLDAAGRLRLGYDRPHDFQHGFWVEAGQVLDERRLVHHHLRQPTGIAQHQEADIAQLPQPVQPPRQAHALAHVRCQIDRPDSLWFLPTTRGLPDTHGDTSNTAMSAKRERTTHHSSLVTHHSKQTPPRHADEG